jgi:energy-coupling factor transporter ATP-binding protein EcfA2
MKNFSDAAAIEIRNLNFTYASESAPVNAEGSCAAPDTPAEPDAPALKDVNLSLERGTISVLIGPSGCGKTTFLRCLSGIIPSIISGDLSGDIYIEGSCITGDKGSEGSARMKPHEIARSAGLVMQEPDNQIVMTTVEDDIAFGPENMMIPPQELREITDDCADTVGLTDRLTDDPHLLSGGGKQRLAIAGALAAKPGILLFDEPLSGLDAHGRTMFEELVRGLKSEGKTIVIVEHDYEPLDFADRWILMKNGAVISAASPELTPEKILEEDLWR